LSFRSNSIDAVINGKTVVFKYGMAASEEIASYLAANPAALNNMFTLLKGVFFIGLNHANSNKPKGLNIDNVLNLMDDVESEEAYNKVKEFALECLGFTLLESQAALTKMGANIDKITEVQDLKKS
jgi:hypothetical protein